MTAGAAARAALELLDVTKRFGAATALDGATLAVREGTVHAVLGENGAGKTTLLRVAFGMVRPDAGAARLFGTPRRFAAPADAIAAGIGMVHQHFTLVPAMTVAENVALGGRGRYDAGAAAARVRALGEQTGLVLDPAARVAGLGVAAQQRLEIVKALAREARLLVLDEPGAVLTPAESQELLAWLRRFAAGGATVVLITHKLRDALAWADDVTVLRRGRTVHAGPAAAASEASLAAAMLGERAPRGEAATTSALATAAGLDAPEAAVIPTAPRGAVVARAVALRLDDARGRPRVREATFAVHAGEIVGVAAVEGSGQHELLRAVAGRLAPSGGTLERPADVAFIPEDRQRDALLLDGTLAENLALRGAGARRGRVAWRALARGTAALVGEADVRGGAPAVPARALSGGNQQKFVVARELAGRRAGGDDGDDGDDAAAAPPALVVAENPTRGLDIRATAAVHARLRAARDAGAAVIVHSSDLDEVLSLADRVLAVYDGRVIAVAAEREAVGRAMLGG